MRFLESPLRGLKQCDLDLSPSRQLRSFGRALWYVGEGIPRRIGTHVPRQRQRHQDAVPEFAFRFGFRFIVAVPRSTT